MDQQPSTEHSRLASSQNRPAGRRTPHTAPLIDGRQASNLDSGQRLFRLSLIQVFES
ncbi:hypothetical protein FIBSPDRAFT_869853 [Athelia psychrophila]|uniref:Uncharacterized protein n=1 Tax=Athelia psychrophila TaxID=1759441 RepID=A0A166BQ13_9AGAM|nr:hypothetical protein FIBSPDRAFT_869853 [Fibularhizoctonia sp. CBS 109695]